MTILILLLSILYEINLSEFIYVDTKLSYTDAQSYCQNNYGTDLATIKFEDLDNVIQTINGVNPSTNIVYTGLRSTNTDIGWFEYIEDTECQYPSTGACVDFWITDNRAPRCIKPDEDGYYCTVFNKNARGLDNNINCDTTQSFLCNSNTVSCGEIDPNGREYVLGNNEYTQYEDANTDCVDKYGTTLPTVVGDADFNNIKYYMCTNGLDHTWLGLDDKLEEGNFKWRDGTQCELDDGSGECTPYWRASPVGDVNDNIGDLIGTVDADCIAMNIDGDVYELRCDNDGEDDTTTTSSSSFTVIVAHYLCNAPIAGAKNIALNSLNDVYNNHVNYNEFVEIIGINIITCVIVSSFVSIMVYCICLKKRVKNDNDIDDNDDGVIKIKYDPVLVDNHQEL